MISFKMYFNNRSAPYVVDVAWEEMMPGTNNQTGKAHAIGCSRSQKKY